jgi:hypothetical protein
MTNEPDSPSVFDAGSKICADLNATPRSPDGLYRCEDDAGHYPATPHNAFTDRKYDVEPLFWDDEGNWITPRVYDRAEVQARMDANDAKLKSFAMRRIQVDGAQLIMQRLGAMCDALFGDMDSQVRLKFESELADAYATQLAATETAINRQMLASKFLITPKPQPPEGLITP